MCGVARAKPDVFKVLKTYDEPADLFNPSANLLWDQLALSVFLCIWGLGGGEGW